MDESIIVDTIFTKYNISFKNLLALESLFHDIGRFRQLKETGTFNDHVIKEFYPNMEDHGDLGAKVIKEEGLLKELIPDVRIYDEEVTKVIRDHSKVNTDILNLVLKDYIEIFRNYDLKELFQSNKNTKEKEVLSAINTVIVQDVDRLDIFRKIVKGIWIPMTTTDEIDPCVWELFKQGKLPLMSELKSQGLWNANVGHLVRMSFINQMNLVPELIKIRDENLIDKIYSQSGNDIVRPAYEFAKKQIDEKINNSSDGIIVSRKK